MGAGEQKALRVRDRPARFRLLGHWVTWKNFGAWTAVVAVLAALACGVVGLFTRTVMWDAAILAALSTGFVYIVAASRESNNNVTEILRAVGRLTPVPETDDIFRHARYTLQDRHGKDSRWKKVRLYAPVGVWLESELKDLWLKDLIAALNENDVDQCWGVYGLPPTTEPEAFYDQAYRRLKLFTNAKNTQLHYLPPADVDHPGAAPGVGIIVFQSYGDSPDYVTIFLFMGDDPKARSGFVVEDRGVGYTVASWFDSQVFKGCSANYVLRPEGKLERKTPAEYLIAKLTEIGLNYYPESPAELGKITSIR